MAAILRDWLPNVIQSADPWMSGVDIGVGSRWESDLDKELEKANFGILCLTAENMESTWIHYEAGALSKIVKMAHVCPYLLDLEPTDVKGPLVRFQMAKTTKEDTLKLVQTINRACLESDRILPDNRISTTFEKFWPDLKTSLDGILSEAQGVIQSSRSPDGINNKILKTLSDQSIILANIQERIVYEVDPLYDYDKLQKEKQSAIDHIIYSNFIKNNTKWESFLDMIEKAKKFMRLNENETIILENDLFDEFLSENTKFLGWEAMTKAAAFDLFARSPH